MVVLIFCFPEFSPSTSHFLSQLWETVFFECEGKGFRATLYLINVYDFLINSTSVENGIRHALLGINAFNGIILYSNFLGNNKELCILSRQ